MKSMIPRLRPIVKCDLLTFENILLGNHDDPGLPWVYPEYVEAGIWLV